MADFTRLFDAVEAIAAEVASVAAAIRNPATDNNDQDNVDILAGRLESLADSLHEVTEIEVAEDGSFVDPAKGSVSEDDDG